MTSEITEKQYDLIIWEPAGAHCTCRVLEHPDLQEWAEDGLLNGRKIKVYWVFDGEPDMDIDGDFHFGNVRRVEEVCEIIDFEETQKE